MTQRRTVSAAGRKKLLQRDDYRCQICTERLLQLYTDRYVFDLDHMRALKNHGTNEMDLLRCLCLRCHRVKTAFDNNPPLWEKMTGLSKHFAGPLATTAPHLSAYYQELRLLIARLVQSEDTEKNAKSVSESDQQ